MRVGRGKSSRWQVVVDPLEGAVGEARLGGALSNRRVVRSMYPLANTAVAILHSRRTE